MAEMSNYCKAYRADQLRRFPGWAETTPPLVVKRELSAGNDGSVADGAPPTEATEYFYLHDNFVVTAGIFRDQNIAFNRVSNEWKAFCKDALKFEVPA
jgi:hypothetical protein